MAKANGKKPVQQDHIRVIHRAGTTQILDAKGRNVDGVIACDMALRPGVPPLMRMNLVAANFEVDGVPVFQIYDPSTCTFRPVARVEFADGGADFVPAMPPPRVTGAMPAPGETFAAPAATPTHEAANGQGDASDGTSAVGDQHNLN